MNPTTPQADSPRALPGPSNNWLSEHARLLQDSFRHWTGRSLLADSTASPHALYEAPFVVVSHDTAADPVFNYANVCAQTLFDMPWAQFTATPSRLSAEPLHRDARAELMARVTRDGYIDDYAGIRIAATGRRFRISEAIVWNLLDAHGSYCGQAATFSNWTWLD